jgi:2-methylcitrate dehydratase PrpD
MELAKYVVDLEFEDLPTNVLREAKKAILDYIGAALAGSKTVIAKKVVDVVARLNCEKDATIFGFSLKSSMPNATFANTTFGSYLELDDLLETHIGAIVMPSAVAVGEKVKASGKSVITAIVAGYEVQARISKVIGLAHFRRGIDHCGCGSTFCSAVAAAKLLNLSLEQTCNSIGIAGSLTPVSCEEWMYYGSLVKSLEMGQAAQIGVLSAMFAQNGIDGPPTIFEGDKGFCQATASPEKYNLDEMTENLGISFEILRNYYKPYASCAWTHEPIEAVLSISKEHPTISENVKSVKVRTHKLASDLNNKQPKNELEAKFSIPYTLAVAITDGEVLVNQFSEEKLKDPRIMSLAQKIDVIYDEKINEGAIVEVLTNDGREFRKHVPIAHGIDTYQGIKDKFLRVIPREFLGIKAKQIIQTVKNLEKISDISELTELLHL